MRTFLLILCLSAMSWATPALKPVGRWKIFHSDGRPIFVTVSADGRCASSSENQKGSWKLESGQLLLLWSDGWKDVISQYQGRLRKAGYAPGVPITARAVNLTAAFKLSR